METGNKKIILNCEKLEIRFALLTDGRIEEYQIERANNEPKVGAIYLGRIVNLEPSLQAAFVDIGAEKNAFLHYHDMLPPAEGGRGRDRGGDDDDDGDDDGEQIIELKKGPRSEAKGRHQKSGRSEELKSAAVGRRQKKISLAEIPNYFRPGTELLVQVVKSPISTKGARVTADLSLAGRYLVLMPYSDHIGLSNKIDNEQERTRLKKILAALDIPDGMGVICRTVGEGRRSVFFKRDLDLLLDSWNKMEAAINTGKAPLQVYAEPDLIDRTVRDFMTEEIGQIVVDDQKVYKHICDMVKQFGGRQMASKVIFYDGPQPIFDRYSINEQLKTVYNREVRLPTGGNLCIDETEALIAIDVNSGRGRKSTDQPEFILKTNLEAAAEVARQLRLRNVGGLVVIDFIDMRSARDRDEVYKSIKKLVKNDRAKTKVAPISKFGLMEMTRQREQESIQDKVYNSCPYCQGSGRVKSPMTMSVEIQRRLNMILKDSRYRNIPIRVIMHPDVLARLKNEDSMHLRELEDKYKHALSFRADPSLHSEEFQLIDPETGTKL